MNTNMLKNIYYSLLYSHLVYSIQVWGSACIIEINKILVLQKRALRIITRNDTFPSVPGPLYPTDPLFYKLEILNLGKTELFVCVFTLFILVFAM